MNPNIIKYLFIFLLGLSPLYSNSITDSSIHWGIMIMTLLGGLALFLYGMAKMSDGMKKAAGEGLRNILSTITKNRFFGLATGAFVTMVIQSSSATTVMLVSFVQAKLMTFVQTISVILGANIGTTVTAQIIAFKLTDYALAMIAIGFAITIFAKKDSLKYFGEALLGFGILFFGMKLMSDAMRPLRTFEPFINIMQGLENPVYGLLVGTIFTALIQSSSAFTGIVIVLAQQGLLTLDAGIPMILGANIGTCVTAGLASFGASRAAKRVAIAHILFNILGVLIFVWLAPYLADLVRNISPKSAEVGITKLAMETPRQIANAHTIFNVSVGLLFLPLTKVLSTIILKILPTRPVEKGVVPVTWHLDDSAITTPAVAIGLAQTEILRMSKILKRMLNAVIEPFISKEEKRDLIYPELTLREGIDMREEKIDYLEEKVTKYLFQISKQNLSDQQASEVYAMMAIVNDMESIGDIVHRDLLPLIDKKSRLKKDFTNKGKKELKDYHISVMKQMSRLELAFSDLDFKKAKKILVKEEKYQDVGYEHRMAHIKRVQAEKSKSIITHEIHLDLMDMLKQIHGYLRNMAEEILEVEKYETKQINIPYRQ